MNIIVKYRDTGATITAHVYLDHVHVVSFRPGTRHETSARRITEKVLSEWLAESLTPRLIAAGCRIVPESVVTAYDPGSDAVQLDHEECWWPYNGDGTRYEVVPDEPSSPGSLQDLVISALDDAGYGFGAGTVFRVVAPVFADWLAAQPKRTWQPSWTHATTAAMQRDHDVRLILRETE